MESDLINKIEKISLKKNSNETNEEKVSIKKKIKELEFVINNKICELQKELQSLKEKEEAYEYNFSDVINEFKQNVTNKIQEVTELLEKKIDEQQAKHTKLFNILISIKNENASINKSISMLNDKIHLIEEEIGD
ncbi:conserved protein, unknown function [Hepatocystis sp. ex Piliocolobus tephrosceles]|nr:conserved protein, unknown function [Hepatocystis sp. ex Piliocolobus tephrosceles]